MIDAKTIHAIGNNPNAAPKIVDMIASWIGIPYASNAITNAAVNTGDDLGARAKMSEASVGEQAGAGLDSLTPQEFERLHALNGDYRARFGFPFLFAVKGASKHEVVAALERRRFAARDEELAEALRQVARIARFRLEDIIRA